MNILKGKNWLILIFIAVFTLSTPILTISAQETTQEATDDAELDDAKSIKELIKNADLSKVKGAINNLLNRKIAMIGQVSRITDETITIKNLSGTKILALNDNPKITKNEQEIDVDKIEVENWVMVLGKLKDDNFSPNFISVSTKTLRPKTQVVTIGTITSISNTSLTIIPRSSDQEITYKLSTSTVFKDSNNEEVNLSSFSSDINVLVTGLEGNGSITVSTLRSLAPLSDE